jgi:hypothetical protein
MDALHQLTLRMTVLETLVGMLFAERALHEVEPIAAVKEMRAQILRIMGNTTASGFTPEQLATLKAQLADAANRLFNEIEGRVRDAPSR